MSAAERIERIEDRLFELGSTMAARRSRMLFRELNPGLDYPPILDSPPKRLRPASVLIPILQREEGYRVLFTVRSPTMPSHAGEISFPGGGPREEDSDEEATALREAHEEVGIAPDHVTVTARFGPHIGGLGYSVTPVVGLVRRPPEVKPCTREVAEAFEVPLDHLLELDNYKVIDRTIRDVSYRMTAVPYQDEAGREWFIWGLTAGIVHTLALAWHDRSVAR